MADLLITSVNKIQCIGIVLSVEVVKAGLFWCGCTLNLLDKNGTLKKQIEINTVEQHYDDARVEPFQCGALFGIGVKKVSMSDFVVGDTLEKTLHSVELEKTLQNATKKLV